MRSVSSSVMQGDTPGLALVSACVQPTVRQLMAHTQPGGYARLGEAPPILSQIKTGDPARYKYLDMKEL